jgi:hypothetical protein
MTDPEVKADREQWLPVAYSLGYAHGHGMRFPYDGSGLPSSSDVEIIHYGVPAAGSSLKPIPENR